MNELTFDLVWMQRLTGDTEVLRRGIPASEAMQALMLEERCDLGMGGTVFLRPSDDYDADYWREQAEAMRERADAAETAHADAWKLIGRCDIAFELISTAQTLSAAKRAAQQLRDEIKKASGQ